MRAQKDLIHIHNDPAFCSRLVEDHVQQGDHILRDLALCQQHLEHLVAEYLLQGFGASIAGETENMPFLWKQPS